MGYTTNFEGKLKITPKLSLDDYTWLVRFNEERHEDKKVPWGYYCQWLPTDDGEYLEWDGSEKFYSYVEWLKYLVKEFFKPKGYKLNGEITWEGEEQGDVGKIIVEDNKVSTKEGKIVYD